MIHSSRTQLILSYGAATAIFLAAVTACSSGTTTGTAGGADGGATGTSPTLPSGDDASFADCDRQASTITEAICGSTYEELWTCPAGHAKLPSCTLSTQRDSFCCPLTPPPACKAFCAAAVANECFSGSVAQCGQECALDRELISRMDHGMCDAEVDAYLGCVGKSATSCKDKLPFAASCEKLGEASITCQTEGDFSRSPSDDAKCAAKDLPSRAYVVDSYGYAPGCISYDGDKTLAPGEVMCCAYP